MLPWVLLYGFTALLFNHPESFPDSRTEFAHFQLTDEDLDGLPSSRELARTLSKIVNRELSGDDHRTRIEPVNLDNARFTRQFSGSAESESRSVRVVVDPHTGKGRLRFREKEPNSKTIEPDARSPWNDGFRISVECGLEEQFNNLLSQTIREHSDDTGEFKLRNLPPFEFDALMDNQKRRFRFQPESIQGRKSTGSDGTIHGTLMIAGENPRKITWRNYLLRLHTASGFPGRINVRWIWAIAVDLMFASMVFWGLSGVLMWWQIKRTRTVGLAILSISAMIATVLAIGMHWQMVHG